MLIAASRGDGHRRGVRHAVDAVDPHQRLPGPRAGQGDRHLGRHLRLPARRSDPSRRACCSSTSGGARCSSSTCRSSPSRSSPGWVLVPKSKDAGGDAARPGRRACSRSSASARSSTPSSRARTTAGLSVGVAAVVRRRGRSCSSLFCWWELRNRHPMLDLHLFRNPPLRRGVGRHHAGLLRHVRHVLPAHAVPAGRARLLAARRGGAAAADLVRDDGVSPRRRRSSSPGSAPTSVGMRRASCSRRRRARRRLAVPTPTRATCSWSSRCAAWPRGMALTMTPDDDAADGRRCPATGPAWGRRRTTPPASSVAPSAWPCSARS